MDTIGYNGVYELYCKAYKNLTSFFSDKNLLIFIMFRSAF